MPNFSPAPAPDDLGLKPKSAALCKAPICANPRKTASRTPHHPSILWRMTRCLDCGSERLSDQCPSCGLTSAAAELVFRRRLVNRTAIFLVGSLIFPYISQLYPPLDLDLMLVFFGLLFFLALTMAFFLDRRARAHQELEILKRVYSGFIPLPWLLAAALFLNGRLDTPKISSTTPRKSKPVFI